MEVTLRSNRGDDEIVLDLGPAEAYGSEAGAVSSFKIRGQHWDGDHDHELFTSVEGLWLRNEDLTAVRDRVAEWVQQPLDRLATSELVGDFELARLPGQSLRLRFGPRPDIESGRNAVLTVSFASGTLRGEFHLVTDPSCLGLFAQGLSSALGSLGVPSNR